MGSPLMLCPTGVRNSLPVSGRNSAPPLGLRSVSPPAFTRRRTVKRSVRTRSSKRPCDVWPPPTKPPGANSSLGSSMRITASPPRPPVFPPSRPLWASNRPCSRRLKVSILCLQFNSTSEGVGVPGGPRRPPSSEQRTGTNAWRTAAGPQRQRTRPGRRFGCRPGLFLSGQNRRSCLPPSLAHLWLTLWLTRFPSVLSYLGICAFMMFSTCLR